MYLLYTVYTMHCIITIDCPLTVTVYSVNTALISQLVKQCKPGHMAMYGDELQRAVKNRNCFYSQLLSVNGRKLTELQRKTIRWHLRQRISSVQRRTVNGELDRSRSPSVRLDVTESTSTEGHTVTFRQRISSVQRRTVNGELDRSRSPSVRLDVTESTSTEGHTVTFRQRISSVQRRTVNGQLSVRLSVWTSPSPRQRKAIRWHFVNVSLPPTWTSPSKSGRVDVSVSCINGPSGV